MARAPLSRADTGTPDGARPRNLGSRIVRLSLETLEKQSLTAPPAGSGGELCPALSPDGTQLAFVRAGSSAFADLDVWVEPVERGEPRRLTFKKYDWVAHLAWTSDGGAVVYDAGTQASSTVLRVPLSGGDPEPIPGIGQGAGAGGLTWPSWSDDVGWCRGPPAVSPAARTREDELIPSGG